MTGSLSLEIYPLQTQPLDALADNDTANGPAEDGALDQLFWNDRPVQGVLMSGIEPEPEPLEKSPSSRICVFGCMRNGIHQWLTGTKYPPSPPCFTPFVLCPPFHYLRFTLLLLRFALG